MTNVKRLMKDLRGNNFFKWGPLQKLFNTEETNLKVLEYANALSRYASKAKEAQYVDILIKKLNSDKFDDFEYSPSLENIYKSKDKDKLDIIKGTKVFNRFAIRSKTVTLYLSHNTIKKMLEAHRLELHEELLELEKRFEAYNEKFEEFHF
jgi:hypothetical protein